MQVVLCINQSSPENQNQQCFFEGVCGKEREKEEERHRDRVRKIYFKELTYMIVEAWQV